MELLLVQSRRARLAALSIAGPLQSKEHHASGTPRRRLPASRARWRRDGACKTAALGDALLRVTIRNIQGRILRFFGRVPNSPESTADGARPRFGQLFVPPPGNPIAHLVIHANIPIIAPCEVLRIAASGL